MDNLDFEDIIQRLRRQGSDDGEVEAKACSEDLSKDIWETVSAFANTSGGIIILGLSESNNFTPVESFDPNRIIDQFVSACSRGLPNESKVDPVPDYEIQRMEYEGHQLLAIRIEELPPESKPCYVKSKGINTGSYKRVDDRDDRLSSTEIYEMRNSMIPSKADREAVEGSSLDDLNQEMVDLLIERQRNSKALRGIDSTEQGLYRLSVLTKNGEATLSGLLSMGNYPQQYFPKLFIDVTAHPGTQKSDPNGPRFLDRVLCEGYLSEVINEAIIATMKNLKTYSYVNGATRTEEPEIPIDVIREAIVNAVVHREYNTLFKGQAVSVDIYTDRVEITNPGALWGGKTIRNLDDGQSRCRNQFLMNLLSRLPGIGDQGTYAEGQGSGIALMKRGMKAKALGSPRFYARMDSFTVVLPRGGAGNIDNPEWYKEKLGIDLDPLERSILAVLKRKGRLHPYDVHKELGIDSYEAEAQLAYFNMMGVVKEEKDGSYSLIEGITSSQEVIWDILSILSADKPMSMRELQEISHMNINTLRARMAKYVKEEKVIATAPPTDRNRKYLLADGQIDDDQ